MADVKLQVGSCGRVRFSRTGGPPRWGGWCHTVCGRLVALASSSTFGKSQVGGNMACNSHHPVLTVWQLGDRAWPCWYLPVALGDNTSQVPTGPGRI